MQNWQLTTQISAEIASRLAAIQKSWKKAYGFSDEFVQLLLVRGVEDESAIAELTSTDDSGVFTYWRELPGAEKVAGEILKSLEAGHTFLIYGDYDVDGITSTSLLWRFLYRELGADVTPFIPHREREGYGLNRDSLEKLLTDNNIEEQAVTLITVDCGVKDVELISELKGKYKNLKVLVTDHHQLPESDAKEIEFSADAVAHPLLSGSGVSPREICACAVVWGLVCAIRDLKNMPQERTGLELVALATVCDIMPLVGVNRKLVRAGLDELASSELPGVNVLMKSAGIKAGQELATYHLGFTLGPRINAVGRIGEPMTAVRLLCTDSQAAAIRLAQELEQTNRQRQLLTEEALDFVQRETEVGDKKLIFVRDANWKEGIIGLIAGKLNEKFSLPAIAVTRSESGHWVGSARSIAQLDITKLLGGQAHLLERYGGHAEAAGFSVLDANLQALEEALAAGAADELAGVETAKSVGYDLELDHLTLASSFIDELNILKPFGNANPMPKFYFPGLRIESYRQFGKENAHMSFKLPQSELHGLEAIWFNHAFQIGSGGKTHDVIGTLGYNIWQGKKYPQINIRHHRISVD